LDGDGVGVGDSLGLLATEMDGVGESNAVGERVGCAVGVGLTTATAEQPASTTAAAVIPPIHAWRFVTPE
jgi:hypothetical protein